MWHVADLSVPIENWGTLPAHVVGIATGIYQTSGVITATRFTAVTTLIHSAFPDRQRSIELWLP